MTKTAPRAAANVAGKRPDAAPGETMMDIGCGTRSSRGLSCRHGGRGSRVDQGGVSSRNDKRDARNGDGRSSDDSSNRARDNGGDGLNNGGDGDVGWRGRECDGWWQTSDDGRVLRNVRLADTQEPSLEAARESWRAFGRWERGCRGGSGWR
ncbi:hypothetical protein C7212DRAFT_357694 [Tuber magnatum]|uniref:Uncharacterized protein n=1 Tax=Tuber magnatum TaxID=42249 RepID=A0A317SQ99_9PEZI|nr:hypothetical protein C7212DRAFT_357694 [Tuber magnatum]